MQINNSLHFSLGEIGERHIVSHEETESGVIVLEIERRAHAFRHLIDEAEDTFVGTGMRLIHQIRFKVQTQFAAFRLANPKLFGVPVRSAQLHGQAGIIGVILVIQHIMDWISVDRKQHIANLRAAAQRTVVINVPDRTAGRHICSLPFRKQQRRGAQIAPLLKLSN